MQDCTIITSKTYNKLKGDVIMEKTENVFIRVEPQIKEQAEAILKELGISMSNAVGMFLRQLVLNKGLPFEVKLPADKPLDLNSLSEQEFNTIMENGMQEYSNGNVQTTKEVKKQAKLAMKTLK